MYYSMPIPVAARSKAWICGRSLAGIVGSNPAYAWRFVCCEYCVLYVHVEVCSTGWSLVQRNPADCVCVCVLLSVIKCNCNCLHLQ